MTKLGESHSDQVRRNNGCVNGNRMDCAAFDGGKYGNFRQHALVRQNCFAKNTGEFKNLNAQSAFNQKKFKKKQKRLSGSGAF